MSVRGHEWVGLGFMLLIMAGAVGFAVYVEMTSVHRRRRPAR